MFLTSIQWVNYENEYLEEKARKIQQLRKDVFTMIKKILLII